jgi:predicted ATPase
MRIDHVKATNYKSLRNVTWYPGSFTVVIGANASGKSNLTDFVDFISDMYNHGLSVAVARKGGYENIAHRKQRRSRGAMQVCVVADFTDQDFLRRRGLRRTDFEPINIRFTHEFSFRALGQGINADFKIEYERLSLLDLNKDNSYPLLDIKRNQKGFEIEANQCIQGDIDLNWGYVARQIRPILDFRDFFEQDSFSKTELSVQIFGRISSIFRVMSEKLSNIRVFQFSPTNTRNFGVPVPNPEMDIHGGNLPAVISMLQDSYPKVWSEIMETMSKIIPNLEKIDVDYTSTRTLGLYFFEKGFGRAWNVSEISDGTIHTLALLVALHDPRTTMLVLEEPENSVHSWILRNIIESAGLASKKKQIMFTTHSPIVVNSLQVDNVWVMWRSNGESQLAKLRSFDREIVEAIDEGEIEMFDLIDTGAIPEAIPQGPSGI